MIIIEEDRVNSTVPFEREQWTQYFNLVSYHIRKRILTLYPAIENEPFKHEWRVPTQRHISNLRCQYDTHPAGLEIRNNKFKNELLQIGWTMPTHLYISNIRCQTETHPTRWSSQTWELYLYSSVSYILTTIFQRRTLANFSGTSGASAYPT